MEERELFLKSHEVLLKAFHLINSPILYAPEYALTQEQMDGLVNKRSDIVLGKSKVGEAMEFISPIPKEITQIIVTTFCESHKKLLSMLEEGKK